jgi:hypothetical protein
MYTATKFGDKNWVGAIKWGGRKEGERERERERERESATVLRESTTVLVVAIICWALRKTLF